MAQCTLPKHIGHILLFGHSRLQKAFSNKTGGPDCELHGTHCTKYSYQKLKNLKLYILLQVKTQHLLKEHHELHLNAWWM